ncbi:MAG: PP2C family protein-serine/threonine phosphatase [Tepidisphaeraceae bacterium]
MSDTQRMVCMEVWGGYAAVDSSVSMSGLDAWVYSTPYGGSAEGGGDVYYVSACATGRINRLLVADVSGHGAAVTSIAAELRTLMRRYVNYIDQTQFVRFLNHQLVELAREGMFATALATTFFAPNNVLQLCNAGHPPPLLYRAKTKTWSLLEGEEDDEQGRASPALHEGNIPLGILDIEDYDQFHVTLAVGDLVLCYTDSLIETRPSPDAGPGELLGTRGLLEIARSLDVSEPGRLVPALLDRLERLAPNNLSSDDVTVLLFRPNGTGATVPLKRKLAAPVRVLRGLVRSLRPGGPPIPWPELTLANLGGALINPLSHLWHGGRAKDLDGQPRTIDSRRA